MPRPRAAAPSITHTGPLTITDSIFSRNVASSGGAVYGGVMVTVAGSSFSDNNAGDGAALYVDGGTLDATGSSFSDNGTASTDGAIPAGAPRWT